MSRGGALDPKGNLTLEMTGFVGRRPEIAQVKGLLSGSRLVSLTGVAGVGKTRLALRVATDVRADYADGAWLVGLAGLDDPTLVAPTVATAMGVRDESRRSPIDTLTEFLSGRHVLLVLDNCEHMTDACAVLAETLLRKVPDLRILATSRQVLGVTGEYNLVVPPLSTPDPDDLPGPAELARYDAARLFADRAAAVIPGFSLTEGNAEAAARLCRRLDGLPLAIELAAVRLRTLTLGQILERLDDRFRLLNGGSRTSLPRQQTLQALIGWSFDLCSAGEQAVWTRLSVFAGGFTLNAAEEVCSGEGIPRGDILDLITGLVDKSILMREEGGFRLLDTIRQYGQERLYSGGGDLWRRRHRDYYRHLAEQAEGDWFGPSQMSWIARLRREHGNIRKAIEPGGKRGEVGAGLGLATSLWLHWRPLGWVAEGRGWIERLLALDGRPSPARAKALWVTGWLAIIQGDLPQAIARLQEAEALGRRLGDVSVIAYVTQFSGQVAMCQGDLPRAARLLEQALDDHRSTGDPVGIGMTLIRLSLVFSVRGQGDRALAMADECLTMSHTRQAPGWVAYAHWIRAVEMWRRGDAHAAIALAQESVRLNWRLDDRVATALGVEVLAWAAMTQDRPQRAARLLGALHTIWQPVGAPLSGYGHLVEYHDDCHARARQALGERDFDANFALGASLPLGQAISDALDRERPAAPDGLGPLTRRETEIAENIARGLTNKQIADKLFISRRTVATHIENALAKLEFTSRTQIATWITRRQLPRPTADSPDEMRHSK